MSRIAPRLFLATGVALLVACASQARPPTSGTSPPDQAGPVPAAPPPGSAPPAATPAPPPVAAPAPPPPRPGALPDAPSHLFIGVERANLRGGPDTKSRILAVLRRGTRLTVVAKGDHWYRVRLDNGTEGWVAESVVTSTPSD